MTVDLTEILDCSESDSVMTDTFAVPKSKISEDLTIYDELVTEQDHIQAKVVSVNDTHSFPVLIIEVRLDMDEILS